MAAVGQRLEIRQGQSLVMTPQLQQAIKLLQLSNIELAEYCEQELERNPILERDDSAPAPLEDAPPRETEIAGERADEALSREDFSKAADMDQAARDNTYDDGEAAAAPAAAQGSLTDWTQVKSSGGFDEEGMESSVAADLTLKDHLEAQLAIAALLPEDRLICLALIDGIDEAGYLRAELPDLVQKLGCEIEDIQAVLGVLQG